MDDIQEIEPLEQQFEKETFLTLDASPNMPIDLGIESLDDMFGDSSSSSSPAPNLHDDLGVEVLEL